MAQGIPFARASISSAARQFTSLTPLMTHPLNRDAHRMKLGVMAFNCSRGSTVTLDERAWLMTWQDNVRLAQMADEAGFEALLPVGRWKGYGGASNFNHRTFESFTWAAGIAAKTNQIGVLATVHAPLVHPVTAAKQAATIDHIADGRFALNLVCGWNRPEFEMFGVELNDHARRYEYAAEWLTFVRKLWNAEDEFNFDGEFFQGRNIWSQPKPVQANVPVMNAGSSATGQAFSAKHCDMNFVMLRQQDHASDVAQIQHLKQMARTSGRKSQCWIHAYVVCANSEQAARDYLDDYVREHGDWDTATRMVELFGLESNSLAPEVLEAFKYHFIAGHGGYPLVGTPDQIVEEVGRLAEMGVDGLLLSWLDYLGECQLWIDEVMPRLQAAGLRVQT